MKKKADKKPVLEIYYTHEGVTRQAIPVSKNPVKQVIEVMAKVDTKSPEAKQNATSISDGKGGRIKLGDQPMKPRTRRGYDSSNTIRMVDDDRWRR